MSFNSNTLQSFSYAAIATCDFLYYASRVAPNAAAQAITANTATIITLDTEVYDTGGYGSLLSNQITLAAGTYVLEANLNLGSPTSNNFIAKAYLYDVTNSKVIAGGYNTSTSTFPINVSGMITIQSATIIELRCFYGGTATDVQVRMSNEAFTLSTAGLDERVGVKIWRYKENFSTGTFSVGGNRQNFTSYAEYGWVTAPNTAGQSITANTITTLTIDTEVQDIDNIGSIASNQITLVAGTYLVKVETSLSTPTVGNDATLALYNVSDSSYVTRKKIVCGNTNTYTDSGTSSNTMETMLTIGSTKTFDIRFYTSVASTTVGVGSTLSSLATANADQRTTLKVWKK